MIDDKDISGLDLLTKMTDLENPDDARVAFRLFCAKYSHRLLRYAGVCCNKWDMSITDGERAIDITFERALRHHSFNPSKCDGKDLDKGIEIWLKRILHNVIYDIKTGRLSNLEQKEKTMEVVYDTDSLYDLWSTGNEDDDERLKKAMLILDKKMKGMSENMRIIYLTYMAYETQHHYLPRSLTAKLQEITGLPQSTIKVYKQRAKKYIQNH